MPVDEGFQATAQDFINEGIAANYWRRDAKLRMFAALGGENSKPTNTEIGRPSGQQIFTGSKLGPVKRMSLGGYNSFKPSFAVANPTAVQILGARDALTGLATPTAAGGSQGQIRGTAEVRWTGVIKEEILIWKTELDRSVREAGASKSGRGVARTRIIQDAVKMATQNVYDKLALELQGGAPSDQDADPWDHLLGFNTWFSATNVCARVDRSASKNAQWRSIVDSTTRPPVISKLIDVANITNHLLDLSEEGTVCFFVNDACWPVMRDEAIGKGFQQISNVVPEMAAFGAANQFAVQKDGVFIIRDTRCPASTAYALVPDTWMFITEPDHTWKVSEFVDLSTHNRGSLALEALRATVELQCMLVCTNPGLNMVFSGITDPT